MKKRVDLPYPNSAGVLSTAGGIVVTAMIDGTILAYDDQTLDELWRINVGSGFNAAADDLCGERQAIHRHRLGPVLRRPRRRPAAQHQEPLGRNPELRLQGNATMVYVFGL